MENLKEDGWDQRKFLYPSLWSKGECNACAEINDIYL